MNPTTFAVVGIHGYGSKHLAELAAMASDGVARVVAVADPRGVEGVANLLEATPCYPNLESLLAEVVPDVVTLATPIHTHAPLATMAMKAGAHVLVEKPTASSLAEFEEVVAVSRETGRSVQVGFQSFGSQALGRIHDLIAEGAIGEVTAIGGLGTWMRNVAYYERSRWAGRRTLDGAPVVDGVVTNPLAHSIATALRVAGTQSSADVAEVEVELYRAHDIEADDTSSVRLRTVDGRVLTFGLTLCAAAQTEPQVLITGTTGTIAFRYTDDTLHIERSKGGTSVVTQEQHGRVSVLRNLADHIADPTVALLAPVEETGAFMRVLEAVRTAPDPTPIDPAFVMWNGEGSQANPYVDDVETWCARVVAEQKLFSELGAPWAASTT